MMFIVFTKSRGCPCNYINNNDAYAKCDVFTPIVIIWMLRIHYVP